MIVGVKEILKKANEENYAVGAFNTVNLETTQAILEAADEMKSPVIIQITEKTMNYSGGRAIFNIIKNVAEFYCENVSVGIHLDHGKSFEIIERAIEIGMDSVMYDGSRKKYSDNLMTTKKVSKLCEEKGVSLQAELGNVPYMKEVGVEEVDWDKHMTDPKQAEDFVRETGIYALAVAIGNAHDFAKERPEPDFKRLSEINNKLQMPLVMHGASDWESDNVKKAVELGINCFNVDTAIRVAFISSLSRTVNGGKSAVSYDVREHLGIAREAVKEVVKKKIEMFGSKGKA